MTTLRYTSNFPTISFVARNWKETSTYGKKWILLSQLYFKIIHQYRFRPYSIDKKSTQAKNFAIMQTAGVIADVYFQIEDKTFYKGGIVLLEQLCNNRVIFDGNWFHKFLNALTIRLYSQVYDEAYFFPNIYFNSTNWGFDRPNKRSIRDANSAMSILPKFVYPLWWIIK